MAEQHKTLVEYSNRMDEYDKKNEETNRKFSTLLQVSIEYYKIIYFKDTYNKQFTIIYKIYCNAL